MKRGPQAIIKNKDPCEEQAAQMDNHRLCQVGNTQVGNTGSAKSSQHRSAPRYFKFHYKLCV